MRGPGTDRAAGEGRGTETAELTLVGPGQDIGGGPARGHTAAVQLALPHVEGGLLAGGRDPRVVGGPEPPGPGLVRAPDGLAQLGVALGARGEAVQYGRPEQQQAPVVVAQRELVQRPGPAGAGGGVLAEHEQRVPPAVRGEVAQDGEREAGAGLVLVEEVLR